MTVLFWVTEYCASFIEILMCCIFCGIFLGKEKLEKNRAYVFFLSIVGACIIIQLNHIAIFSYINSFLFVILLYAVQLLLYRKKVGISFVLVMIYGVLLLSIDFMLTYFTVFILKTDADYLVNNQSSLRMMAMMLSKTILILVVVTIYRIYKKSTIFMKSYSVILSIDSIFLLVALFVMAELNMKENRPAMNMFLIGFFLIAMVVELLTFYFVIKAGESYEQKQQMELTELKNEMLQKTLDETEQAFRLWRNSVHDYKNNMIALTQLAEEKKLEEIQAYLRKENELITKKMFYVKTGNSIVDAIVNTKQNVAEELGITFVINASLKETCKISEMDLATILGNLIDNAIEASEKEEEPYVDVTIGQEKKFLVIKIVNKFTKELSQQVFTHKDDKIFHGIGIGSVKSIVEKYSGEFTMEKADDEVVVKVILLNN